MTTHPLHRLFGFLGAMLGMASVALAAVAGHAWAGRLDPQDLHRAHLALAFAFGHALLLLQVAALMRHARGLMLGLAGTLIAAGIVVFSGSLLGRALAGWSTALAPIGGTLLMAGWVALAVWFVAARPDPR